uniref:Uncharacterized protein n=1 Tax=Rangifer tarandus platyrhynchus TaxID=3082113 RepID=A0ACB0FHW3_RANTA|nr:unnamed protein product [Rangifer tarandus platyrhynchus]
MALLLFGTSTPGHPRTRGRRGHLALERCPETASFPAFPCSDLRLSTSSGPSRRARGESTPPKISPRDHQKPGETTPRPGGGSRCTAGAHPLGWTRVSGSSRRGRARGVLTEPGDPPPSPCALLPGPLLRCREPV